MDRGQPKAGDTAEVRINDVSVGMSCIILKKATISPGSGVAPVSIVAGNPTGVSTIPESHFRNPEKLWSCESVMA